VGLNIYNPENDFPDDIKNIAGAIFNKREEDLKNRFIAQFLNSFFDIYKRLPARDFVSDYKSRLNVINQEIYVISIMKKRGKSFRFR
jgi:BirA family biotin operon repressor/biotin-[acetyl-CoA-carboxylase] ligase